MTALDRHQGAFVPVALFHSAGTPTGVFIVNSIAWIVSWTLLCAAVAQRLTTRTACAVSAMLLVVATTSQVVGWHGAVSGAVGNGRIVCSAVADQATPGAGFGAGGGRRH
jgi:hypothetical protein